MVSPPRAADVLESKWCRSPEVEGRRYALRPLPLEYGRSMIPPLDAIDVLSDSQLVLDDVARIPLQGISEA